MQQTSLKELVEQKLEECGKVGLHLGCGDVRLDDSSMINIDIRETDVTDFLADVTEPLNIEEESVDRVEAFDVLEHFSQKEINLEKGYLAVQPSIASVGLNKIRLEKNLPTVIGIFPGEPISVRPLRKQDLENYVRDHNKNNQEAN